VSRLDYIAWGGTAGIMGAYALMSLGMLNPGLIFQAVNLAGAIALASFYLARHVRQGLILNLFWAGVAAAAIGRLIA